MINEKYADIKCLYVEDDSSTREQMQAALSRRFSHLAVAADGQDGLNKFREDVPDIVITDIRMPNVSGLEMAAIMKVEHAGTKIILTTAHSDTPYLLEAIEKGVDAYVVKPIELAKLFSTIDLCVESLTAQRALREEQEKRDRLLEELKQALAEIKTLRGIVPICACCKKIRDDEGFWEQVETYVSKHSHAQFSHSLCPTCFDAEMKKIEKL